MTAPSRSMMSGQVAGALHLSQASIARYARLGIIPHDTTPGGHFRFNLAEVRAALDGSAQPSLDPEVLLAEVRELTKAVTNLAALVESYAGQQRRREKG